MSISFQIRPTFPNENKYTYTQSMELICKTGCIGHLRADLDYTGEGFYSTWEDHCKDQKTDIFKAEFDQLINRLRFGPGDDRGIRHQDETTFLMNRAMLSIYCWSCPTARMQTEEENYGFRIDTDSYTYMMRLNPKKGEYNLYCYCYRRDLLDMHLKNVVSRDKEIEQFWSDFSDVPMNPETECMEESFLDFPAGTDRETIWHWFDEQHSKGIHYLLYEHKES